MAGAMRKMAVYLGLVEDHGEDAYEDDYDYDAARRSARETRPSPRGYDDRYDRAPDDRYSSGGSVRPMTDPRGTDTRAVRTFRSIGKMGKGALSTMHPEHLSATVLAAIKERNNLNTADVDDVIWGVSGAIGLQGGDIGRNIFFVPLAERKVQLEQIPWVESASVMRFVPNRLGVEIHERTPVAFARIGARISLIDAGGTLMELTPNGKRKYSFPVIAGMNSGEPLSTRAARMKNYNDLVQQLDADGASYSRDLSEVDLSDPEDVKVVVADPSGEVLVHLGSGNYLQRYKVYVTHVQQWRQQFDKLESVDLRYDGQIIVNPDLQGIPRPVALTPAAAKAAMSAGVKPPAIVNYEKYVTHPVPYGPPVKKTAKPAVKAPVKPAIHRAATKPKAKHAPAKYARGRSTAGSVIPASSKKPIVDPGKTQKPVPVTKSTSALPAKSSAAVAQPAAQPAKPVQSASGQKKPSPIISKEAANPR